jgi:serine protease Do
MKTRGLPNLLAGCVILAIVTIALTILSRLQPEFSSLSLYAINPDFNNNEDPEWWSESELRKIAAAITVKVIIGQGTGSGFLIAQEGDRYTLITNQHVVDYGDHYQVQTVDGKIHTALSDRQNISKRDLATLQFESSETYAMASLEPSTNITIGETVFAVGFPQEVQNAPFRFTKGEIALISPKVIQGGYQIGYTNDVQKGMSGGPLLNSQGRVVGINGIHKYPLWGNTYVYEDGTESSDQQFAELSQLSWAIPIAALKTAIE